MASGDGYTNLTNLDISGDFDVGGDMTVTGAFSVTGDISITASGLTTLTKVVDFGDMVDVTTTGTYTFDVDLPAGAFVLHTKVTAITGFTGSGTTATCRIGAIGDLDRFMTGTPDVFVTAATGVDFGVVSGTGYCLAATTPIVTVTVSDFTDVDAGSMTVEFTFIA